LVKNNFLDLEQAYLDSFRDQLRGLCTALHDPRKIRPHSAALFCTFPRPARRGSHRFAGERRGKARKERLKRGDLKSLARICARVRDAAPRIAWNSHRVAKKALYIGESARITHRTGRRESDFYSCDTNGKTSWESATSREELSTLARFHGDNRSGLALGKTE